MHKPFVIFGLPRSRTTWLSQFLSYGDWHCGHDELRHMRQLEDVRSWLSQPNTGTVETAGAPFWRLALHMSPDLRVVTIRRDPDEAARSAVAAGLGDDIGLMTALCHRIDRKLDQIERRTGARSFRFEDLVQADVCADLFEHLLPYRFDRERWRRLDLKLVETHVPTLMRYINANLTQIERLRGISRQKSLALLNSRRAPAAAGLAIGFEPLRDLLRDGVELMREHLAEVGEHPDNLAGKNLTRLQAIEDAGGMQVTVARCNGKVFGYLVTLLGESLEAKNRLWGCHAAFYASANYPGLGLKIQSRALDGLRERGVYEAVARAGVRGAGDRVSAIYRRLGFEPFGEYYRLQLGEPA